MSRGRRPVIILFAPVPVLLLACLLEALGTTRRIGDRIYDLFLRIEPAPPIASELLLVDIDDHAIGAVGAWPWSRDMLADGLLVMKELGARYALFDTPFTGRAPLGVDRRMLREELPDGVTDEMDRVQSNVQGLFDAIRRGSIRPADSPRYVAELVRLIAAGKERLLDAVARVERDSDEYLGQTLRLFEQAFVAVELDTSRTAIPPTPEELIPVEHFSLSGVDLRGLPPLGARSFFLPAPAIAIGARGGGYREVTVDPDGVVRRARLLSGYRERAVGQVAFAALLDRLGGPDVSVSDEGIVLDMAERGSRSTRLLTIPLTPEGDLLIDWPHQRGRVAARHLSWMELHQYDELEADLVAALREMDRSGYFAYHRADPSVIDLYGKAVAMRDSILGGASTATIEEWREARDAYLALADAFLGGDAEQRIVADADRVIGLRGPTEEEKAAMRSTLDAAPELFRRARSSLAELTALRAELRGVLSSAFCVISPTGASAAVIGRTPLGPPTTTGEASAAIVNAVLTGRFFRSLPGWYSVAGAALLCLITAAALLGARPTGSVITGLALAVLLCVASALVLILARIYVDPTAPAGCILLVCACISLIKVHRLRAERSDW